METPERPPSVEFLKCVGTDGEVFTDDFSPGERSISPQYSPNDGSSWLSPELQDALDQYLGSERPLKRPKGVRPSKTCDICFEKKECRDFSSFPCSHTVCTTCFGRMRICHFRCGEDR